MSLQAVRTISEDDNFRTIEGLAVPFGGPFNGKDTYGTFFSVRTELDLDLHDGKIPITYNHGFDPDFGMSPLGYTTSVRTADDGVWVEAQLSKRHKYYAERIAPLLDAGGLGFSAGSAEHSYRLDEKTGEVLTYPVHEIAVTPTEANPWATLAARTGEYITIIDAIRKEEKHDLPALIAEAVRTAAMDAAQAYGILQQILGLRDWEASEMEPNADQLAALDSAVTGMQTFASLELAEPNPTVAAYSAVRAGKRNAAADLAHIDAIHTHVVALGASAHSDSPPDDADAEASRSAEVPPTIHIVERTDEAYRPDIDAIAVRAAEAAVKRLTR